MKAISQQRLIDTAGVVVFAIFSAVILYNGASVSMLYDEAYNASVAKNLSLGLGYVSTYHTIEPFDPWITTGPTLLVPAALMMKVFGNTPWAPNVATAIVTLAMLAFVLRYASRRLQSSFGLLALSCIPPLTILLNLVDGWNRLRGDILSAELVVLGALVLPFEPANGGDKAAYLRRIVTAGVVMGLAALTKLMAVPCIAAIAMVFIAGVVAQNNRDYREAGVALLALGVGVVIPNMLFEIVRFVSLGGLNGYVENLHATLITNANQESSFRAIWHGVYEFSGRFARISEAVENWRKYVGFNQHPVVGSLLVLSWALCSALGLSVVKLANRLRLIALAIAGGGLVVLFFTVFLVQFPARVQLGACVLSLFVGFATAEWANVAMSKRERTPMDLRYRHSPALLVTLIAMFSAFWLISFSRGERPVWAHERASVAAASEAMLAIRARDPLATFCGIGWLVPRVLEYATPGALWFRDCSRLEERESETPAAVYLVRWLVVFLWKANAADKEFARQCNVDVVYENAMFAISRCPAGTVYNAAVSE